MCVFVYQHNGEDESECVCEWFTPKRERDVCVNGL